MDDLIRRKDAVSRISDLLILELRAERLPTWNEVYNALAELPSAQQEPRWIPVTERLPEKDGMYLVSISPSSRLEKRVDTDFYSHFGVWQIFGKFVTAWCELPDPYKESEVDDDETIH